MTDERSEWSLLKPEEIPDEAVLVAAKSMCLGWIDWDNLPDEKKSRIILDARKAIAAAINAWMPYHVIGKDDLYYMEKRTICLRLPEDKSDD